MLAVDCQRHQRSWQGPFPRRVAAPRRPWVLATRAWRRRFATNIQPRHGGKRDVYESWLPSQECTTFMDPRCSFVILLFGNGTEYVRKEKGFVTNSTHIWHALNGKGGNLILGDWRLHSNHS